MLILTPGGGALLIAILSRINWKHGMQTAIAAGTCLLLTRLLHLHQGYWACISAIVVMQSHTGATLAASWDRLVGTAIGALVGWVAALFWQGHVVAYFAAILVCMLIPLWMGVKNAGRLAGVAATIIMLVPTQAAYWRVARDRFLEVSIGIVVALVVSHTIWPTSIPSE